MEQNKPEQTPERAILVAVDTGAYDAEESLDECRELARTAGAEVAACVIQKRPAPEAGTYLGTGRLEELAQLCSAHEADLVIIDGELTATQQRNMEQALPCRLIDRTMLILDIFAGRARSSEGRLQVELAQLQYLLPRLTGMGKSLSRLGGGIGTRGPGETKLESDRRHIRARITALRAQLRQVEQRRLARRQRRRKDEVLTAALVGYTNAGKSTLMNRLTDAGVLAENKLFATLDPTARALMLPSGRQVLLIDTVGLIRRLPHHRVQAFRSTLEEAADADLILNVCDAASPQREEHLQVTRELLASLGAGEHPQLTIYNKCDRLPIRPADTPDTLYLSAAHDRSFERLLQAIDDALPPTSRRMELLLPFSQGALAGRLRREGTVEAEDYTPEGLRMTVTVDRRLWSAIDPYRI